MEFFISAAQKAARETLVSLSHNWPFLLAGILVAAALKVFADPGRVSAFLRRFRRAGVLVATAAAVGTPLCSCGSTAVVLGMMAATMPWAPVVAFMVASPLSSPEGLVYSAGLFGWPFAVAYFAASIILGLAGGLIAALLEKAGFLEGQARMASVRETAPSAAAAPNACACSARPAEQAPASVDARLALAREAWAAAKRLLPLFLGFAFLGYLINGLAPASWISALFGAGRAWSVPLAATIGLPLYVNSEASLPLARGLLESGMSQGSVMAFLIAGSGTSLGAIAGALTIARRRVVGLVVGVLWIGAMLAGFGFDALVAAGIA